MLKEKQDRKLMSLAKEIRSLGKAGESHYLIGLKYGISEGAVKMICNPYVKKVNSKSLNRLSRELSDAGW